MKLFILILMFSANAYAGNYYPVGKAGAKTVYSKKQKCESIEGQKCFDISMKDLRRWKKGLVDNPNDQRYAKRDIAACTDMSSCQPLLEALDCSQYVKGSFPVMAIDFTEVYCAEPNGFNKREGLVPDTVGILQADIDDAKKVSDRISRRDAKVNRKLELSTCRGLTNAKTGSLTGPQTKKCIRSILRELMGKSIPIKDL